MSPGLFFRVTCLRYNFNKKERKAQRKTGENVLGFIFPLGMRGGGSVPWKRSSDADAADKGRKGKRQNSHQESGEEGPTSPPLNIGHGSPRTELFK